METVVRSLHLGDFIDSTDDIIKTSKGVWCTSLDRYRLMEVCKQYETEYVSYTPHPLLALSSSKKRQSNSCMIVTMNGTPSEVTNVVKQTLLQSGMVLHYYTLQECRSEANLQTITRAVRTCSFAIFDGLDCDEWCYLAVSASTPFCSIGCKLGLSVTNLLTLSSCTGLICTSVDQVLDVYKNSSQVARLLGDTSLRLKNMLRWLKNTEPRLVKGNANVCIDIRQLPFLLRPWVGVLDTFDQPSIDFSSGKVQTSLLFCTKLLVTDGRCVKGLENALLPYGVRVGLTRPIIERKETLFSYKEWCNNKKCTVVSDKMVCIGLKDKSTSQVSAIVQNSIAILDGPNIELLIRECIASATPVVTKKTDVSTTLLGENYPLMSSDLSPPTVLKLLTEESVAFCSKYMLSLTSKSNK